MSLDLTDFAITPERGFLCPFDADEIDLPPEFDDVEDAAAMLPDLLVSGRIRQFLEELPVVNAAAALASEGDATRRTAFVRYSFLAQAYVWGEPEAPSAIPAPIAAPLWWLADATGQKPLLTYQSYVLDNWGLLEPGGPITLDNTFMIQNFLAGQDEAWFVLVHVAIEARAGAALALFPSLIRAAEAQDAQALEKDLTEMIAVWDDILALFDRMPERCDPYIYFQRVRPYIHGWQDNPALPNGLPYEGVAAIEGQAQAFRGQTGSQSSIVPAMDALLQLRHSDDPLKAFLDELHDYRPPAHRQFIDATREASGLRDAIIELAHAPLKEAYNEVVKRVAAFRTRHLEYAATYINKQSAGAVGNDTDVGTGGTPFMRYLKKHRDEAEAQLLG